MTRITVPRIVLVLVALIGGFWLTERLFGLIYRIADILLIFGLAWLLKLLLDPLMRRLRSWHVPRGVSIAIAYLLFIGAIVGVFMWLVPQLSSIAQRAPALARQLATRAEQAALWANERGIEINPAALTGQIVSVGGEAGQVIAARALNAAQNVLSVLGKIALVITVSVYMSLTKSALTDAVRPIVPPRWRDEFDGFVTEVNNAYSSYIRGYFYIVAIGTLLSAGILFGFQIPGAFLWLTMIFVARLLPFIGGILANIFTIVPVMINLTLVPALIAIGLMLIGQFLITNVLMPRIMSRELGINPLMVMFAVLLGGRIYGVAGILFAIPAAAVLATVVSKGVKRYLTPLYARGGWWREEVTVIQRHDDPKIVPEPPDPIRPTLQEVIK